MITLLLRIWALVRGLVSQLGDIATAQTGIKNDIAEIRADLNTALDLLHRIIELVEPQPAVAIRFTATLEDGTILEGVNNMDLRDDQQVALSIQPVDKKGKPALVDGVPVWASSDETVITVSAGTDGLTAVVLGVAPGAARVVVTADADLGAGVTDLTGTLDFNVTAGGAVALNIVAGTPTDQ